MMIRSSLSTAFRHHKTNNQQAIVTLSTISSISPPSSSCKQRIHHETHHHPFSTRTTPQTNPSSSQEKEEDYQHPQDFVKIKLEPGEYNPIETDPKLKQNPLFRPPWKPTMNRAQIMSADDFANRPRVGFDEEFETMYDAMLTFGWMDVTQTNRIYQMYIDMMTTMSNTDRGVTSHEYVFRVVAQEFNISVDRVAGIVKLRHEEDRIREDPDRAGMELHDDVAAFVDAKMKENIDQMYKQFEEENPGRFIEDPVAVSSLREDGSLDNDQAGDLYDVDLLNEEFDKKKLRKAREYLDNYIYAEDVDERTVDVKLNKDGRKLLRAKKDLMSEFDGLFDGSIDNRPKNITPDPAWGEDTSTMEEEPPPRHRNIWNNGMTMQRRPRWKYAAKMINTRQVKERRRAARARGWRTPKNADKTVNDTLIEHDGVLRPATVAEAKTLEWRPKRDLDQFIYEDVLKAWVDRTIKGDKSVGWGNPDPEKLAIVKEKLEEEERKKKEEEELEAGEEGENETEGQGGEEEEDK